MLKMAAAALGSVPRGSQFSSQNTKEAVRNRGETSDPGDLMAPSELHRHCMHAGTHTHK